MQPDAAARAAHGLVPVIGKVHRERTLAIELRQTGPGDVAAHEVDAQRRALVAFLPFVGAQLAHGDIEVPQQPQTACLMGEQVQPRLAGVDGNGMPHGCAQHQKLAGNGTRRRRAAVRLQAALEFVLQILQLGLRGTGRTLQPCDAAHGQVVPHQHALARMAGSGGRSHGRARQHLAGTAGLEAQQVCIHQLGCAEIGDFGGEIGGRLQGAIQIPLLHLADDGQQAGLRLALRAGRRLGMACRGSDAACRGRHRSSGHGRLARRRAQPGCAGLAGLAGLARCGLGGCRLGGLGRLGVGRRAERHRGQSGQQHGHAGGPRMQAQQAGG